MNPVQLIVMAVAVLSYYARLVVCANETEIKHYIILRIPSTLITSVTTGNNSMNQSVEILLDSKCEGSFMNSAGFHSTDFHSTGFASTEFCENTTQIIEGFSKNESNRNTSTTKLDSESYPESFSSWKSFQSKFSFEADKFFTSCKEIVLRSLFVAICYVTIFGYFLASATFSGGSLTTVYGELSGRRAYVCGMLCSCVGTGCVLQFSGQV